MRHRISIRGGRKLAFAEPLHPEIGRHIDVAARAAAVKIVRERRVTSARVQGLSYPPIRPPSHDASAFFHRPRRPSRFPDPQLFPSIHPSSLYGEEIQTRPEPGN